MEGQNVALKKSTQNAADAFSAAQTKLNGAKGAVKETAAEIDQCNRQFALSRTSWASAGEAIQTSQSSIASIGKQMKTAESSYGLLQSQLVPAHRRVLAATALAAVHGSASQRPHYRGHHRGGVHSGAPVPQVAQQTAQAAGQRFHAQRANGQAQRRVAYTLGCVFHNVPSHGQNFSGFPTFILTGRAVSNEGKKG